MKTKQKTISRKAKEAITKYVSIRAEKRGRYLFQLIDDTLKADRMPRTDLYEWLKRKGYRWNPTVGIWYKQKNPD